MRDLMRWGCIGLAAISVTALVGLLSMVTPVESPKYGHRGAERRRALANGGVFALFEPAIRFLAALLGQLPLGTLRASQLRLLQSTDDVLGFAADELSALSLLSAAALGTTVHLIARAIEAPIGYTVGAVALGLALPTLQLRQIFRERAKAITRALPPAIEIAAMCMSAGLDFPGSLRMLAERNTAQPTPLGREFAVILEHLDFGHTRKFALEQFAARVPNRAVIDFVHALVQAEQKGNPLARVLQVQGRMLNMRRSVAAEEAAARAGVLMILPMVLLLGAILLLLMGPFIVKGIGW